MATTKDLAAVFRMYVLRQGLLGTFGPSLVAPSDAGAGHTEFLTQRMVPVPLGSTERFHSMYGNRSGYVGDHPSIWNFDWQGIVKVEQDERLVIRFSCPDAGDEELEERNWLRSYVQFPGTRV